MQGLRLTPGFVDRLVANIPNCRSQIIDSRDIHRDRREPFQGHRPGIGLIPLADPV